MRMDRLRYMDFIETERRKEYGKDGIQADISRNVNHMKKEFYRALEKLGMAMEIFISKNSSRTVTLKEKLYNMIDREKSCSITTYHIRYSSRCFVEERKIIPENETYLFTAF